MKSLSTDGVWLFNNCSKAILIGNITRSSLHNYVIMKMVLHAKKLIQMALYASIWLKPFFYIGRLFNIAYIIPLWQFSNVHLSFVSADAFFYSFQICFVLFFWFHNMENVNDSMNLHANSQFHWITADFLVPMFCSLFNLLRCAQMNLGFMIVFVDFEETTLSHIVGVRRQAFC